MIDGQLDTVEVVVYDFEYVCFVRSAISSSTHWHGTEP